MKRAILTLSLLLTLIGCNNNIEIKEFNGNSASLQTTNLEEEGLEWLPPLISQYLAADTLYVPPPLEPCEINTTIFTGDVLVSTQSQINALSDVHTVDGDLIIGSVFGSGSYDLTPLETLVEITGDLRFNNFVEQDKVEGFDCLEKVGGVLSIFSETVTSIEGFNKLNRIDGDGDFALLIINSDKLESIKGFNSLISTGDDVSFFNNEILKSIDGFLNLSVDNVAGDISVSFNDEFDCSNPKPGFVPIDNSFMNLINCETVPFF